MQPYALVNAAACNDRCSRMCFRMCMYALRMFFAYPREAVPNGFQRTAFEVAEPPMRECQLEQEESDANQEAQRGAAIEVHLQPVSVINETSDNGLGDISVALSLY